MSIATNAIENLLLAAEKEMIRLEQVPRRDREAIFKLSLRMQALEEAQAAVAAAERDEIKMYEDAPEGVFGPTAKEEA
jgi:hypothetical protein